MSIAQYSHPPRTGFGESLPGLPQPNATTARSTDCKIIEYGPCNTRYSRLFIADATSLILIPDIGSVSTSDWAIRSTQWSEALARSNLKLNILSVPQHHSPERDLDWSWLSHGKDQLLKTIQESRDWEAVENLTRPLLFMAHGLGGVVLKVTLTYISWNDTEFGALGRAICGAIFLGCPHKTAVEGKIADQVSAVYRKNFPSNTKMNRVIKAHTGDLCDTANMFERIGLEDLKLLTIRESGNEPVKPYLIKLIYKSRKTTLDPSVASLNMSQETTVDLNVSHDRLCQLTASLNELNHDVATWIEDTAKKAFEEVSNRMQRFARLSSNTAALSTHSNGQYQSVVEERLEAPLTSSPLERSSLSVQQGSSTAAEYQFIPSNHGLQVHRPQPDLPCFSVDNSLRNEGFFGRTDILSRLDEILLPSHFTSNSFSATISSQVAILGIPGIGKSEVAAAYAFSRRSRFDAIFWIQADTTMKLEDSFAQIARKLNLKQFNDEDMFDAVAAREETKGWLSNPKKIVNQNRDLIAQADATWLLILDNADEPSVLADYWPVFGTGSVLVTSNKSESSFQTAIAGTALNILNHSLSRMEHN